LRPTWTSIPRPASLYETWIETGSSLDPLDRPGDVKTASVSDRAVRVPSIGIRSPEWIAQNQPPPTRFIPVERSVNMVTEPAGAPCQVEVMRTSTSPLSRTTWPLSMIPAAPAVDP